jgi:hypothetical protein
MKQNTKDTTYNIACEIFVRVFVALPLITIWGLFAKYLNDNYSHSFGLFLFAFLSYIAVSVLCWNISSRIVKRMKVN